MEDNGVRETDLKYRKSIDKAINIIIQKWGNNVTTISGTTEERIEQIKNALA